MRILLTVPMDRPAERLLPRAERYPYVNDNGLASVASSCRKARAEVTLLGWNVNYPADVFRQKLLDLQPAIVGMKIFTTHFKRAWKTLRLVRDTLPECAIVIGGPHPSSSRPSDLFREFDGIIDFAVAGDGEAGMSELIGLISENGKSPPVEKLRNVAGLIYRNGTEFQANPRSFDTELDRLAPIDWSMQEPKWFNDSGSRDVLAFVDDSRGCPNKCGFCNAGIMNGPRPRRRSLDSLKGTIAELVSRFGVNVVAFTGNVFMSDKDYVASLCEWLIDLNGSAKSRPLRWITTGAAYTRNLLDPDLLSLMKRAGCERVQLGIESGNPGVRARLCQTAPLELYSELVPMMTRTGIKSCGFFMFGFPDETVREMFDTIRFAVSLPFSEISFCICLPLPGTSGYDAVLARKGIEYIDWNSYDFSNPAVLPCRASIAELKSVYFIGRILNKLQPTRKIQNLLGPAGFF